jgi:cytochrome c
MSRAVALGLLAVVAVAPGCQSEPSIPGPESGSGVLGDAQRGRQAIEKYGCGGCHTIPAVRSARGKVGPALGGLAARPYLAGSLLNEPSNLVEWVRSPRRLDPRTLMPDLSVSDSDARDIAAFLYRSP